MLVITTPEDTESFRRLLNDDRQLGLTIDYAVQPSPNTLAEAFRIGRDFIGRGRGAGAARQSLLRPRPSGVDPARLRERSATVFAYWVRDPQRDGVVEFGADGRAIGFEEKPVKPRSPWALTGWAGAGARGPAAGVAREG